MDSSISAVPAIPPELRLPLGSRPVESKRPPVHSDSGSGPETAKDLSDAARAVTLLTPRISSVSEPPETPLPPFPGSETRASPHSSIEADVKPAQRVSFDIKPEHDVKDEPSNTPTWDELNTMLDSSGVDRIAPTSLGPERRYRKVSGSTITMQQHIYPNAGAYLLPMCHS